MSQEVWTSFDQYVCDLFVPHDPVLEAALRDSAAAGLPSIQVTPNQGKMLYILARAIGARRILELGTLGGYSTIWLARALPPGGSLVTLEFAPKHAQVAQANLERAGLAQMVEVRVGSALDSLPKLVEEGRGPFDLIFIDADKINYPAYLDWSLKLTRPGSLIIADNVVREGKVASPNSSDDPNVQGARRFNAQLAADPRVTASILQTVGSKGYDGFAIALVNG